MKEISVLVRADDASFARNQPGYLIEWLMMEWGRRGFEIQVVRDIAQSLSTDLLIPHLDLTVIPGEYVRFMQLYQHVINRRVHDTSKRCISKNLLGKNDAYNGPVIVKTDRNYGGLPEEIVGAGLHKMPSSLARTARRAAIAVGSRITSSPPWRLITCLQPGEYPVFSGLSEVPSGIFKNKNLVVEKYTPEMDGSDYLLRYYYFFGEQETTLLLRSKQPVVKFSNAFQVEEIPVHPRLRQARAELGFDYGKFDYFEIDGEVVIFDVNKTPGHTAGHAGGRHEALYQKMVAHLAAGINAALDGCCSANATSGT